jgi:hypothetical protein
MDAARDAASRPGRAILRNSALIAMIEADYQKKSG